MGGGTHLVIMVTGDGGGTTSTYTIATACADELVTWLCHIIVIIRRCTGGWGQLIEARQWLLEVGEAGWRSCRWWWWLRM